jgi:multiple antibiotic resistance protein
MSDAQTILMTALADVTSQIGTQPMLTLADVFAFLFVTLGPPLKTPLAFYMQTSTLTAGVCRTLALKTFALATIIVFVGGFVGLALAAKWHISIPALALAGGVVFFLVSLKSVLDQYEHADPRVAPPANAPPAPPPTAFQLAIPMIVTPYGLGAVIVLLTASQSGDRTLAVCMILLVIMVIHLLAMLFAAPMLRAIGPLPFKLFGTIIGILTVALSIHMIIAAFVLLGVISPEAGLNS